VYRPQCCCCCCCYWRKHINITHCLLLFTLKKVPSLPLWGFSLKKGEGKKKDLQQHNVRTKLRKMASRKLFLGSHEETQLRAPKGRTMSRTATTFLTWESEQTKEKERQRARKKGNTCA
jgi:hypothetical protein